MITQELTKWELGANYPYVPIMTRAAETGQILNSVMDSIPAVVPGCVHNDLLRAGKISDPYFEMNSLQCAWVENFWWTYQTTFVPEASKCGRHLRLHMMGIDYEGKISLNGRTCGTHIGMYTPFKVDITDLVKWGENNTLSVLLKNTPQEMGQIGYTSRTHTQKARFSYKWDFSTRLVQIGLYDKVLIEDFGLAALEYVHIDTAVQGTTGDVQVESELTVFEAGELTVTCQLCLEGKEVSRDCRKIKAEIGTQVVKSALTVENPRLWYPNGYGEQPVYEMTVTIEDADGLSDKKTLTTGFYTREYRRAEGAKEECLPYSVVINERQPYIKGVNMVPFDIMYGCIQQETVEHFLRLAKDAHVNLILVWGGGLIESEYFYDLCDRYGLMVWQEFIQSSSGLDNVPSKDPEFLKLCRQTAIHAVRTKQHHPCLTFWCGGNELEDEHRVPCTFTDENIKMLKDIVDQYDGKTFMLPTSATGFFQFLDVDQPGKNYDVHGPWKYNGTEKHYETYNQSDSQLHSEFGVDGMGNLETIRTVLSSKNLKVQTMSNPVWRYHGEMWDTSDRDYKIFGALPEEDLDKYILSSQFIQAEGLRYALESNRRRAFANVGSIIWQFNEPWPNVSCTNLVDYYGRPKLGYYGMKLAFRPSNPNLRYEKLLFDPGETANMQLFMTSDETKKIWKLEATMTDFNGNELFRLPRIEVLAGDGRTAKAAEWNFVMPDSGAIKVEVTAQHDECLLRNAYILFVKDEKGWADRSKMLEFAPCLKQLAEET